MHELAKRLQEDGFKPTTIPSLITFNLMFNNELNDKNSIFLFEFLSDIDKFILYNYDLIIETDSIRGDPSDERILYRCVLYSYKHDEYVTIKSFKHKNRKKCLIEMFDYISNNFDYIIEYEEEDEEFN